MPLPSSPFTTPVTLLKVVCAKTAIWLTTSISMIDSFLL